jgi:hypothetical protein
MHKMENHNQNEINISIDNSSQRPRLNGQSDRWKLEVEQNCSLPHTRNVPPPHIQHGHTDRKFTLLFYHSQSLKLKYKLHLYYHLSIYAQLECGRALILRKANIPSRWSASRHEMIMLPRSSSSSDAALQGGSSSPSILHGTKNGRGNDKKVVHKTGWLWIRKRATASWQRV